MRGSARNESRSTAAPLWGWSGVAQLEPPELPEEQLAHIMSLLPSPRLAAEELKAAIQAFGAKYYGNLHQDEFGPTRAQQMSALRAVLARLEQLDSLLLATQHVVLDLSKTFEEQNGVRCLRSLTLNQLHHAINVELAWRQHPADDLTILKE